MPIPGKKCFEFESLEKSERVKDGIAIDSGIVNKSITWRSSTCWQLPVPDAIAIS